MEKSSPLIWQGINARLLCSGTILLKNGAVFSGASASVTPSALAVDGSKGTVFAKTISSSSTFTFSNFSDGSTIVIAVTTTGSYTATFPTAKWPGGSQPTQTASGTDVYTFINIGGTIYANVVQAFA